MELQEGIVLKNIYKIKKVIHVSNISIVYLCNNEKSNYTCIIKEYFPKGMVLRDFDKKSIVCKMPSFKEGYIKAKREFLNEANTLKKIKHENVEECIDDFEENNTSYIVLKYYEGCILEKYIKANNDIGSAVFFRNILVPICNGVEAIHNKGIIHRDIKPSNIIVTKEGKPVILDFGAAVNFKTNVEKNMFISKGYSPLEFYSKKCRQAEYSDIYSAAATIYYCLSRKTPIEASKRIIEDNIVDLKNYSQISAVFSKVIMKNLAVDYRKRFRKIKFLKIFIYLEYIFQYIKKFL